MGNSPLFTLTPRPLQRARLTFRLATATQTAETEDSRASTRRIVVFWLKMTLGVGSTAATRAIQPTPAALFLRMKMETFKVSMSSEGENRNVIVKEKVQI